MKSVFQKPKKESVIAFICVIALVGTFVIVGWMDFNTPKTGVKDIVAYNALSCHAVGMRNEFHNPTLRYDQVRKLERQVGIFRGVDFIGFADIEVVYLLEAYYKERGFKAVTMMYNSDSVKYQFHDESFTFNENGDDSVIEENGWIIENYNLVAVKHN
jgi:hypothetical protein